MQNGHVKILQEERFWEIYSMAKAFRLNDFIRDLEKKKGRNVGKILPFVRGLRFSTLLIYAIREILSEGELKASWGHIIDNSDIYCSRECDIIIHKPGYIRCWNGEDLKNPVMDFKFIAQDNAVAVISCKSFLTAAATEVNYCHDMKKYVDKVWLFAECCGPKSPNKIRSVAQAIGYEYFWHFYTWSKHTEKTNESKEDWNDFVQKVKCLG